MVSLKLNIPLCFN